MPNKKYNITLHPSSGLDACVNPASTPCACTGVADLCLSIGEKKLFMLGPAGPKREIDVAQAFLQGIVSQKAPSPSTSPGPETSPTPGPETSPGSGLPEHPPACQPANLPEHPPACQPASLPTGLPVLLGSGLGYALREILAHTTGPVAVVDKEQDILAQTKLQKQKEFAHNTRITWICENNPQAALSALSKWQNNNGNLPFAPCALPFYQRLDRMLGDDYYGKLQKALQESARFNFWEKIQYPRFKSKLPKILLITSQYFLIGEIIDACERMGVEYRLLHISNEEVAQNDFVERLLKAVLEFEPDFAFTINHLGVDREGLLVDLLSQIKLPLASWFVDNPHLILYQYQGLTSPWTTIFTWDTDNIASLKKDGHKHVFYLPLGTTPERFSQNPPFTPPASWRSRVSFVGNSMVEKVAKRMEVAQPGPELLAAYRELAGGFSKHDERCVYTYLCNQHPEFLPAYSKLQSVERRLAFETMLTWEATRQYRNSCVEQILPFNPLILGDVGWKSTFSQKPFAWRWHAEISYYDQLPFFYPLSEINFNCTSKQMKGAVNQRVFDVPAAGAFVLTDWRDQMQHLFEPEKEIIFYNSPAEVPELIHFYLNNEGARNKVIAAAQKRIFAQHTYVHRLQSIIAHMQEVYG